jgi:hypothetical protein
MERRNVELPKELQTSLRQVTLSWSGVLVMLLIVGTLLAAVVLPVVLYARVKRSEESLHQFQIASAVTQAEIIDVGRRSGDDNGKVRVTYRYTANGEEHTGRASVRRRDAARYSLGSQVRVRYLLAEPAENWLDGQRPRPMPIWLVLLLPPVLVLSAGAAALFIRRQARLLAEGRAALATVTKADKLRGRESTTWRVRYEWTLLSGAMRTGHADLQTKTPPAVGTTIPVVYDRDHPQRHARYPLSLVQVVGVPRTERVGRRWRKRHAT